MSKVLIEEQTLYDIADAVREKNGQQITYKPGQMATMISDMNTSAEFISKADWDALSMESKMQHGLVCLVSSDTGYLRGKLVSGADYSYACELLPNSDPSTVACFATYDNFTEGSYTWGTGGTPIVAINPLRRYENENAVYFDALSSGQRASIELPSTTSDFTLYVVAKGISYGSGDVHVFGSVYNWSGGNIINVYHRSGSIWRASTYGNADVDLIDTLNDYTVVAVRSNNMNASWFVPTSDSTNTRAYNNHGTQFTFGYRDNIMSANLAVKFVAYVDCAEDNASIRTNINHLATYYL